MPPVSLPPCFIVLGPRGLSLAQCLAVTLPGARIHARADRVDPSAVDTCFESVADHVAGLFRRGHPLILLCATGIAVRAIGPLLTDKQGEPPVVVVADDGRCVIPLVGGHHGANDLARRLAAHLHVPAAVSTAGDLAFGVALDDPPAGWRLANPDAVKPFTAALLAGDRCKPDGAMPDWLGRSALPFSPDGARTITVGERVIDGSAHRLVYHPATLAVGLGSARHASVEEAVGLVQHTLVDHGLAAQAVAVVVSIDVKMDEPAVWAVADALGVPARFFPAARLDAETPRLTHPSDAVFAAVGCHGVAESAALAATGADGWLMVPKRKTAQVTCAVAKAPAPIDATAVGQRRGHLIILGTGPGWSGWRTAETDHLLAKAEHWVGYRLYLDLCGPLAPGQNRHDFDLGDEVARARHALDLAAKGAEVALISSGDPGIFAMAAVVFELLDQGTEPAWQRLAVTVVPGITAMQAAAARVGAPLGHDFCAISLSDLLTPWPVIARRLEAAAAADFVTALYNPVSQRRRWQIETARELFLCHRPSDTPVLLAHNLGRPGEQVRTVPLSDLSADDVDMLTLVLIGARTTRRLGGVAEPVRLYTPRGYPIKTGETP